MRQRGKRQPTTQSYLPGHLSQRRSGKLFLLHEAINIKSQLDVPTRDWKQDSDIQHVDGIKDEKEEFEKHLPISSKMTSISKEGVSILTSEMRYRYRYRSFGAFSAAIR